MQTKLTAMKITALLFGSLSLLSYAHGAAPLPTLDLPWGSYSATVLAEDDNIYLFENVRFGAQPIRFGPSDFPHEQSSTPNVTECLQIDLSELRTQFSGEYPLGHPSQDLDLGMLTPATTSNWSGVEDCLFLDIYVPRSVFDEPGAQPLPVTVWFHGGGYIFGSKRMKLGPLYNGKSLIKASNYTTIFVAGNYRLGAFGWLAGSFMEANGLPNAGLYDQNLLLRWVQKYIGLVHGDNNTVGAWGESAGGGSILHHLIRENGTKNPLFTRFLTQSAAFMWHWDNSPGGHLDQVYQNFSDSLGCHAPYDIKCLRNSSFSLEKLGLMNAKLFENVQETGLFPLGPAVDNAWIKTIPTLAFSQGNFWPGIKSAIVSHCANDALSFTPDVANYSGFYGYLADFLPGEKLAPLRTKIANQYDCVKNYGGDYRKCLSHIVRDASFTCNARDLLDSYPQQAYAMNYGFPSDDLAYHAADLIPLFVGGTQQIWYIFWKVFKYSLFEANRWARQLTAEIIPTYLGYFSSFALYGTTNGTGNTGWPVVNGSGPLFSNVMKPSSNGWELVDNDQNSKAACAFWREIASEIMDLQEHMGEIDVDTDVEEEL